MHIGDIRGIEITDLQRGQTAALPEHTRGILQGTGVRLRKIQFRQPLAAVEHRPHRGDLVGIEEPQVQPGQCLALSEHTLHVGNCTRIKPFFGPFQVFEHLAALEQITHIGHLSGLELPQIQLLQTGAGTEHGIHTGRSGGFKGVDGQILQGAAAIKQEAEIRHLLRLKGTQVQLFQTLTAHEHSGQAGGLSCAEAGAEIDGLHVLIACKEVGAGAAGVDAALGGNVQVIQAVVQPGPGHDRAVAHGRNIPGAGGHLRQGIQEGHTPDLVAGELGAQDQLFACIVNLLLGGASLQLQLLVHHQEVRLPAGCGSRGFRGFRGGSALRATARQQHPRTQKHRQQRPYGLFLLSHFFSSV